jgi:hypothetical protein
MTQLLKYVRRNESFDLSENYKVPLEAQRKISAGRTVAVHAIDESLQSHAICTLSFLAHPGVTPGALLWRTPPQRRTNRCMERAIPDFTGHRRIRQAISVPQIILFKILHSMANRNPTLPPYNIAITVYSSV